MPSKKYDLIVVLGLKFGPRWKLRRDLLARLRKTIDIYKTNPGTPIVVCGRWSIWYDWLGIQPPSTEAALMKTYLVRHGVKPHDILMESTSKDLIGNAYYLKCALRGKPNYKKLLIICPKQQEKRIRFIFYKFFGNEEYRLSYLPLLAPAHNKNATGDEKACLRDQKLLLADVRPGHEEDFKHKLYKSAYYVRQAKAVRKSSLQSTGVAHAFM